MQIYLYKTKSDRRSLEKILENEIEYECELKEATSVQNPSFLIKTSSNISNYNYAYIPLFSRYYFINEIQSIRNNLWSITASVDVLHTYKNEIKNCKCLELRTSKTSNKYLVDADTVVENDRDIETIRMNGYDILGNFTGNMHYVLVCAGKED